MNSWQMEWNMCCFRPGCYNGNRFKTLKKMYPPVFMPEEAAVDMPLTITDVPRLNEDGSGRIEVTTGDVSVPCVGVFSEKQKKAVFLYTIQEIEGINLGLSYEKGKIGLTWPHMRKNSIYRWPFMTDSRDSGSCLKKNQEIEIPYKLLTFECESMEEFYQVYFENRKCMGLPDERPQVLPFDEQFEIQKDKFNNMNWREPGKFYGVGTEKIPTQTWQPGWVGGGMSSYAMMMLGGEKEWQRGIDTLEHVFRTRAPGGFLYETSDENGKIYGIGESRGLKLQHYHLVRKSADVLYFLFKHFELMKSRGVEIPEHFREGTRRIADALVEVWEKYGQFGQFVNRDKNEIIAGGSTCGAIAPAGLVKAWEFFGEEKYLEVAKESAEAYYRRDAQKGYTTGGPGEILQGADSESAFGLLESMVALYELTGEEKMAGLRETYGKPLQ